MRMRISHDCCRGDALKRRCRALQEGGEDGYSPRHSPTSLNAYANRFRELLEKAPVTYSSKAAVIGALMVALWWAEEQSLVSSLSSEDGGVSRTDFEIISNAADFCTQAFENAGDRQAKIGLELSSALKSLLATDTAAGADAGKSVTAACLILRDLQRLGVGKTQLPADFLGKLYENFFRAGKGTPRATACLHVLLEHTLLCFALFLAARPHPTGHWH
jgi:hypothetical protein